VFCLSHAQTGKALLFFLEVDMGTETLSSPSGDSRDVRQKVIDYQAHFRRRGYEPYGRLWNCTFKGFRLLLVADDAARRAQLCGLVRSLPPCEFIWVTDRGSLLSEGVWGAIWSRGGRSDGPPESILGSRMPSPSPSPDSLA